RGAQLDQLVDRLGGRTPGRHHDPHDPGSLFEADDKRLPRVGARRALVGVPLDGIRGEVERNHAVAALEETQGHVAAHATKADDANFHSYLTACLTAVTSARHPVSRTRTSRP